MSDIYFNKKSPIFSIKDEDDVANMLGVSKQSLRWTLINIDSLYKQKNVPKKDGNYRVLNVPMKPLKIVQRKVLDNILSHIPLHSAVYGLGKKKNVFENAKRHKNNSYLLNLDLYSFFPSVHWSRVYRLYYNVGCSKAASKILSRLTTINYEVPQGAPSSSRLSCLVLHKLDRRLTTFAIKNNLTYTRYVDDLFFSGDYDFRSKRSSLVKIVAESGYSINKKEKYFLSHEQKEITGIQSFNGYLSCPRLESQVKEYIFRRKEGDMTAREWNRKKHSIRGILSFLNQVDTAVATALYAELEATE